MRKQQDPTLRGNALLARIRHLQLETAREGLVEQSTYYGKLANRVGRVLRNWATTPEATPEAAAA